MPVTERLPIAQGLFTWPSDEPQLIGSRCPDCAVMTFPTQPDCPRCPSDQMQDELFARRGTLWTFTTQQFVPKSPPFAYSQTEEEFEPYAVGYVEFAGQARVEGRITEPDVTKLRIGMEMQVVVVSLMHDDEGNEIVTYGFEPVG